MNSSDCEINKYTKLAIKYVNEGNYNKGIDFIAIILDLNKNNGKAQYIMGFIFEFYKEDFKKASKWYTASYANGYEMAATSLDRIIKKISSDNNILDRTNHMHLE